MLDELKTVISDCVNKYADMSMWRSIRTAYFWYTYISFLKLLMHIDTSQDNFVDVAVKMNIIECSVAKYIKELPGFQKISGDIDKIDMGDVDITVLYQQYISQDFSVDSENNYTYTGGKNGRDTLGSYYTEEKFAYLITKKVIDDYIYSKLKIEKFSETHENKEQVYEMLKTLKFVDSSCGAGGFLVSIIHYFEETLGLDTELTNFLAKNIYGYDVDPLAVLITKVRIMRTLNNRASINSIYLGNPLICINRNTNLLDKYKIAAEGRFYCEDMGIKEERIKFDVIVGNPPWEKVRFEERKFFSHYLCDESLISTKEDRNKYIKDEISDFNYKYYNELKQDYLEFKKRIKSDSNYIYSCCGELNTYALFTEWAIKNISIDGMISLIVKASLLKMPVYSSFFEYLLEKRYLSEAYMFSNRKKIFQIDSREEFAVIYLALSGEKTFQVYLNLEDYESFSSYHGLELTLDTLKNINPITKMLPNVKSFNELKFLKQIYQNNRVFEEIYPECLYGRLVHFTNHSHYIKKRSEKGYLPIYEGKYIEQYNSKYATYRGIKEQEKYGKKAQAKLIEDVNGMEYPEERYYIEQTFWKQLSKRYSQEYSIAWRSLTSATNRRTMLATILPMIPTCQSIQMLQIADKKKMLQILALFNSVIFDYLVRLKMSGLDLTQTIVKQIAVPDCFMYDKMIDFDNVKASVGVHIYSRIKYLYRSDVRMESFFDGVETYDISNCNQRKKIISELDILIAKVYKIDKEQLKQIINCFDKYYTKEEAKTWF